MKPHLPPVKADAKITNPNRKAIPYATIDAIQEVADPVLARFGMAYNFTERSFETQPDLMEVTAHLQYGGHDMQSSRICKKDAVVASNNKNDEHGRQSAVTYTKRQLLAGLLGIRIIGADDGAAAAAAPQVECLTDAQITLLMEVIVDVVGDDAERRKERAATLAKQFGVDELRKVPASNYESAMTKVKAWAAKQRGQS